MQLRQPTWGYCDPLFCVVHYYYPHILKNYFNIDLLSGRMYTVFVVVATSFSDLLSYEDFLNTSVSSQVMTSGSIPSGVENITDIGVIAGSIVVVLVIVIVATVILIVFCIW